MADARRSLVRSLLTCAVFLFCGIPGARAQSLWLPMSTIGYAGLGAGAGVGICHDCDWDTGGAVVVVGGFLGLVTGLVIGDKAASDAEDGVIGPGRLWAARVGTVGAFATFGALLSAWRIDNQTDNEEGEEERTFKTFTLVGAGIGVLAEIFYERSFDPRVQIVLLAEPDSPGGGFVGFGYRREW